MNKYFCETIDDKLYLKGLCGNDDYSEWAVIETDFWADNKYLDENDRPCWRYIDGNVVHEPLPKSDAQRKVWVVEQIRSQYSANKEYGLINDAINALNNSTPLSQDYQDYRTYVENKKTQSWTEFGLTPP